MKKTIYFCLLVVLLPGGGMLCIDTPDNTQKSDDATSSHPASSQQVHKTAEITKTVVAAHYRSFLKYVFDMRFQVNYTPEKVIFAGARTLKGCDDFSISCIPLAYNFFSRPEAYLKKLIKEIIHDDSYVQIMDEIVHQYRSEKPSNINSLSRITHKKSVECTPLPDHINKEELIKSPEKYKKLIGLLVEPKEQDRKAHDKLMCSFFLARYWLEIKKEL